MHPADPAHPGTPTRRDPTASAEPPSWTGSGGGEGGVVAALEWAAWFGWPGDGVAALNGLDPDGVVPERMRWLAGVCLGAVGRYRTAARWLAPGGEPAGSLAASCLASHLRQVGRHADAEPLDRLALSIATDSEARADALLGLVADAVGRHDPALAEERLNTARAQMLAVTIDDREWRLRVRLGWVTAENALLSSDPELAARIARSARRTARTARACRHAVKSELVLGVALEASGRTRSAARVLRSAVRGATQMGLTPLLVPAHSVLADIVNDRAPAVAARERLLARTAQSIREDPARGQSIG
jgi:hypothetical protein